MSGTWDQKATYLVDAEQHMRQVRTDVEADTTNVWESIDAAIRALRKLRDAATGEYRRRDDELQARWKADEAERLARPADPSPELVDEVRELIACGLPASAVMAVRRHTSKTLTEAREYVDALTTEVSSR